MMPVKAEWGFEASTTSYVDDNGWVVRIPTGWITFMCGCGYQVHDRKADAMAKGRDHVKAEHPTWKQVPGENSEASAVPVAAPQAYDARDITWSTTALPGDRGWVAPRRGLDEVLDAIGEALEGWEFDEDAMRWAVEEEPETAVQAEAQCTSCERCTWNPGPDCGKADHPHCPTCAHCAYRHEQQQSIWEALLVGMLSQHMNGEPVILPAGVVSFDASMSGPRSYRLVATLANGDEISAEGTLEQ